MAFYEIYQADRQIAVMQETLDWLTQFEQVATAMYSVGGGRQSDVLRAGVEVARMQADIARMRAMRTSAAARLNAVLDRPPTRRSRRLVFAPLPRSCRPPTCCSSGPREPADAGARPHRRGAGAHAQALARRELWPDLTLGVQYGQRPRRWARSGWAA
jgi:outer membrane protein, heavy metal efflux system